MHQPRDEKAKSTTLYAHCHDSLVLLIDQMYH